MELLIGLTSGLISGFISSVIAFHLYRRQKQFDRMVDFIGKYKAEVIATRKTLSTNGVTDLARVHVTALIEIRETNIISRRISNKLKKFETKLHTVKSFETYEKLRRIKKLGKISSTDYAMQKLQEVYDVDKNTGHLPNILKYLDSLT